LASCTLRGEQQAAEKLKGTAGIVEFQLSPTGD